MKKPQWRRRSSSYVVESRYMRLRKDEVELPDGEVIPDYYVRESEGFAIVFATTADARVILVRQYRYGTDELHLELPAGFIESEDPRDCAQRELAEETGFEAQDLELLGTFHAEPVRSNAVAHLFMARDAIQTRDLKLDPGEVLQVELVSLAEFRASLADGSIDSAVSIAAGYRALDFLDLL
jgi:ADP-ribose pyrophosphatase